MLAILAGTCPSQHSVLFPRLSLFPSSSPYLYSSLSLRHIQDPWCWAFCPRGGFSRGEGGDGGVCYLSEIFIYCLRTSKVESDGAGGCWDGGGVFPIVIVFILFTASFSGVKLTKLLYIRAEVLPEFLRNSSPRNGDSVGDDLITCLELAFVFQPDR